MRIFSLAHEYRRALLMLLLGMSLLFLDFWSKAYIYHCFPHIQGPDRGIPIFTHFLGGIDFSINLAFNRGAAWGLFSNFQLPLLLLRIVVIGALLLYLIGYNKNRSLDLPLLLIITGAIGNIVDYFLYGYVVDFFLFTFWGWHFPLFNIADSLITIGVLLLFFLGMKSEKTHSL